MRLCALLLVALLFTEFPQKTGDTDELLDSEKELIAWLDHLGYQELAEAPIVRVATGQWTRKIGETAQNRFKIAFLVAEDETEFSVVDLAGETTTHSATQGEVQPYEAVYFDPLDLVEVARQRIDSANEIRPNDHQYGDGPRASRTFEMVLLARVCAGQGHISEAHELFELAKLQFKREGRGEFKELINFLKDDHATTKMWSAVLAFQDSKNNWAQLRKKFLDISEHFPESDYVQRAKETANVLECMIKEDNERKKNKIPPLDELEGSALVAELIYQLRTQNGKQWGRQHVFDIFLDEREENSPAHHLVDIGFDAVPQLIEALDDQRLTRSVGYHFDHRFSHHVLQVGDCAEFILRKIVGREFRSSNYGSRIFKNDANAGKFTEEVEAWWQEVKIKREEQFLIEAVESGNANSGRKALALVKRYPDSAVSAIRKGIINSENNWIDSRMFAALAEHGSDEAWQIIHQQLVDGKTLPTRIEAARVLLNNGQREKAIDQLVHEWKEFSPPDDPDLAFNDPKAQLAILLVHEGSPEALGAIVKDFNQLDASQKFDIVRSLANEKLPTRDEQYVKAVEKLLVDCLQLTDTVAIHGSFKSQSFSNPRICDMAGYVLTDQWPESYNCRLDGTKHERDKTRFAAINHWRRVNQLPPIDSLQPSDKTD